MWPTFYRTLRQTDHKTWQNRESRRALKRMRTPHICIYVTFSLVFRWRNTPENQFQITTQDGVPSKNQVCFKHLRLTKTAQFEKPSQFLHRDYLLKTFATSSTPFRIFQTLVLLLANSMICLHVTSL